MRNSNLTIEELEQISNAQALEAIKINEEIVNEIYEEKKQSEEDAAIAEYNAAMGL